jgi:long-chain fatty acid transport protein
MNKTLRCVAITLLLCTVVKLSVHGNGLNRNGVSADSMAMGGADVGWAQSPLEAMGDNPAGLGFLSGYEFDLGGVMASADGKFSKPTANSSGDLNSDLQGLPEGAFGMKLGKLPVSVAISCIPESMLLGDWHYPDPPGALGHPDSGVSYGDQEDKSEILVLRSALGVGVQIIPQLSIGASLGADYNQNELVTPYVFQNLQPAGDAPFDGAKTLLNLNTSGFGWNAQIGAMYRPITNLQFGLSWQNKYKVYTTGTASGNASAQFPPPGDYSFKYNAQVANIFPQQFSLGTSWKFLPRWRVAGEVDWIDWADAFNNLPVKLTDGTGPIVPGVLGTSFQDNIPLNWRSEFVYRVGVEYAVMDNLFLRLGYCYGHDPVPDSTLNPMTAAIMENTITAGVGYRWRACEFDLAYQCDLPEKQNVSNSALLSGEYSDSSTKVSINWFALTMRVHF